MTSPYTELDDDAYGQWLVDSGLEPEEAHLHVTRRRQRNAEGKYDYAGQEEREAQPDFSGPVGAGFAALLKAGQGASFGLSDELSGDPEAARMTLSAAQEQQPRTWLADIRGRVTPMWRYP